MNQTESLVTNWRSWPVKSILLVAVAACGAAAYWMRTAGTETNHGLVVPENQLNLGEVWESRAFPWSLTISNPTKQDILIKDFGTSCNCLSIEPPSLSIPSGQKAELHLTFNLTLAPSPDQDSTYREVAVNMVPIIDEELPKEKGWTIQGRVRRILELNPPRVDFGTELIRGKPIPPQSVAVKATIALSAVIADCSRSQGLVRIAKSKASPDVFQLKITPASGLPAGRFQFLVTLQPVSSTGEKLPDVLLPVQGLVREDIRALPESLLLGAVPVGQITSETVVLYSVSGSGFKVESIKPSSGEITVEAMSKGPSSGEEFLVKTRISKLGRQEQTIEFSLINQDRKASTLSYQVNYVGIPAE